MKPRISRLSHRHLADPLSSVEEHRKHIHHQSVTCVFLRLLWHLFLCWVGLCYPGDAGYQWLGTWCDTNERVNCWRRHLLRLAVALGPSGWPAQFRGMAPERRLAYLGTPECFAWIDRWMTTTPQEREEAVSQVDRAEAQIRGMKRSLAILKFSADYPGANAWGASARGYPRTHLDRSCRFYYVRA